MSTTPEPAEPAVGEGGADTQPTLHRRSLTAAFVCFAFAVGLAVAGALFVVRTVGEYGPIEARAPWLARVPPLPSLGWLSLQF